MHDEHVIIKMEPLHVESRKHIVLSYGGLCQRRRMHCNRTTSYCSLFVLVLWTSIYSYLVKKAYSNDEHCITRGQRHDYC